MTSPALRTEVKASKTEKGAGNAYSVSHSVLEVEYEANKRQFLHTTANLFQKLGQGVYCNLGPQLEPQVGVGQLGDLQNWDSVPEHTALGGILKNAHENFLDTLPQICG